MIGSRRGNGLLVIPANWERKGIEGGGQRGGGEEDREREGGG